MKISVVGGGGRVGLPLSIVLADASPENDVQIVDVNERTVATINDGRMPFQERGADEVLRRVIGRNLRAGCDPSVIAKADCVIVVIGTPVDEFLNPIFGVFEQFLEDHLPHFRDGQTLVLRSTVYPGSSEKVRRFFEKRGKRVHVAFCPERIAEGKAMEELRSLPQIISGFSPEALASSRALFGSLAPELVEVAPLEAELAKLYCNSWRYIQFATANQYYMLTQSLGLDFYRVYDAMTRNYPRTKDFPKAGFAAGPCLFKDTMQLSAFSGNQYFLGHSAMLVNEGLPFFLVQQMEKERPLAECTVGILGMAFKAESDDKRSSLSYKLKKLLAMRADRVLCTDEYIEDAAFSPLEKVLEEADVLVIGAPHRRYREIRPRPSQLLVDVWNFIPKALPKDAP